MRTIGKVFIAAGVAAAIAAHPGAAYAGPFILAGTDADDHGSASATANLQGWLFMQRSIESLAPAVVNGSKVVVSLGGTSTALAAKQSAFTFSNLASQGWTFQSLSGATAINNFFLNSGSVTAATTGIIMLDSGNNVTGGLGISEEAALTANAMPLNNFLGAGGGLFSQANSYGFLSTLVPGASAPGESQTGITLTAAGSGAFPGLTNADLSAGPYHERFANFGAIPVLGVGASSGNPIIIGASGGSIIAPTPGPSPVPEPATLLVMGAALAGLGALRRKKA